MRIQISYKGNKVDIYCKNYRKTKKCLYLYGINEMSTRKCLHQYGLEYLFLEQINSLMIWIQKHMIVTEVDVRQKNRCLISELAVGEIFCTEAGGTLCLYQGKEQRIYVYSFTKQNKEYTETFKEDMEVYPFTDIPITEIKVRLHHIDTGNCLEVWQSEPKNKKSIWFGRYTYGSHLWYYLSDAPYGYCEPSYPVNPSIEFICCDKHWSEVLRDSNNPVRHFSWFPSLADICKTEWAKIKNEYPNTTKDGFCDWLDAKMPKDTSYDDKINWRSHRYALIDPDNVIEGLNWIKKVTHPTLKTEVIHSFEFMGETYRIARIAKQHLLCDALWYEYVAISPDPDENYAAWYAYEYDLEGNSSIKK